ncbi:hypothetical protein [Rhabdothermincola sediminis]|uniref:hypothetical protein n=1 Tax=Rhabdothermincola sediminis TaxID=2751370 RepID=UPI001AA0871D|nr:hypothetical protein [Rhabdothermincola sediminis]
MTKRLLVAMITVSTIGAFGAAPVGAGSHPEFTLTITKIVEGSAPNDTEFVINVNCVAYEMPAEPLRARPLADTVVLNEDTVFPSEGGTVTLSIHPDAFWDAIDCGVTETDDGGADEVTGREQVVTFTDWENRRVEVVNRFNEPGPTTTAEPTTTTSTAATTAARATPRFTG